MIQAKDRIIVPLDVNSPHRAISLVQQLEPHVGCFKIGLEFMHVIMQAVLRPAVQPGLIVEIRDLFSTLQDRVFWDGKMHDIPTTVRNAADIVASFCPRMFNVHVSGGLEMMREAKRSAMDVQQRSGLAHPINVLGVSVLTSLGYDDLERLGFVARRPNMTPDAKQSEVKTLVARMAHLAHEGGLDGLICSPQEIGTVRTSVTEGFLIVTPGVRPTWAASNDQKRVMTPGEAIRAGADYLVIGRPITSSGDPIEAANRIAREIEDALRETK